MIFFLFFSSFETFVETVGGGRTVWEGGRSTLIIFRRGIDDSTGAGGGADPVCGRGYFMGAAAGTKVVVVGLWRWTGGWWNI